MRATQQILLTEAGWRKLQRELLSLREQRDSRPNRYVEIALASEPGEAASNYMQSDIASVDRRITQLEEILYRAIPVGPADRELDVAGIGSRVTVQWDDGEQEEYVLVGPPEVDTRAGDISYESPVGRALMGRREGEWAEVATPQGTCRLRVVALERP